MARTIRIGLSVLLVAVFLVGCGDDDSTATPTDTAGPTATAESTVTPEPTVSPEPTASAEPTATTPPTATPEPVDTPTPGELPGEPYDYLVPADGEIIGVVGVAYDDILEVHIVPGELSEIVGELPNLAETVEGTGEGRLLPASVWWKIRYEGIEGWAGSAFLARIGGTDDITSQVVAANGGSYLQAETMLDLGMAVADLRKSVEPASRVVVSVAPDVSGDLGEITIDVVGLGDDAIAGERLHVFGDGTDMGGEGFALKSVEATVLCSRGVTSDGYCV